MKGKIGILTGGGDCPGLNPAIRGCVYAAEKYGYDCVGLEDGWKGLVEGRIMPLDTSAVEYIIGRGGTMLGTSRTNPYKDPAHLKACLDNFRSLDLHALVAMGGEDTLGVAARLYRDYGLNVVGVPKTMDNDLSATDYTFGFDTSVTRAVEAAGAMIDTGRSHRRVMVLEVMGRHAGWVALFTAMASPADFVCLPERKVDPEKLVARIKAAYDRKRFALVVTSEAAELDEQDGSGRTDARDEFGHVVLRSRGMGERIASMIEKKTGIETRSSVIGHMQRGGAPTLFDRILGTRVGVKAAQLVRDGQFGMMSALVGNDVKGVSLETATRSLKTVPPGWLELADIFL